ncbi:MAG: CAP domain-containing protein [Actinomycetota bacterium]|nr:CAP domain-containing protein [Actinomycetota bacterium]
MRLRLALFFATAFAGLPSAPAGAAYPYTEGLVRDCANHARRAHGLRPLARSVALDRAARLHARNMARYRFFAHQDPFGRGPAQRAALFDPARRLVAVGENIAFGFTTAGAACSGWLASPDHRANLLDPRYTSIGAGVWLGSRRAPYYVQDFAIAR